jgi:hypothetical protein
MDPWNREPQQNGPDTTEELELEDLEVVEDAPLDLSPRAVQASTALDDDAVTPPGGLVIHTDEVEPIELSPKDRREAAVDLGSKVPGAGASAMESAESITPVRPARRPPPAADDSITPVQRNKGRPSRPHSKPVDFDQNGRPAGRAGGGQRGQNAEQNAFDSILSDAMRSAGQKRSAPRRRRRKKRKKDIPPNEAAMKNRPVSAVGEVQAKQKADAETLPEDSLGGVQPPAPPPPKAMRDRTARIQFQKEQLEKLHAQSATGHKLYWILGLGGLLVVIMGAVGFILYHRHTRQIRKKQLEAKLKTWRIKRRLMRKRKLLPPGQCMENMVWISLAEKTAGKASAAPGFCIDVYEFPNKRGVRPRAVGDLAEAQKLCAQIGKRLCTKAEWQRACRGPENLTFPYGNKYDPSKCATKPPGGETPPVQPSGSWTDCRSAAGVFDMSGNMAEWVAGSTLMGGSAALTGKDTGCAAEGGGGGPAYYGTRCCTSPSEVAGAATRSAASPRDARKEP